jgi:hypothetical protein
MSELSYTLTVICDHTLTVTENHNVSAVYDIDAAAACATVMFTPAAKLAALVLFV